MTDTYGTEPHDHGHDEILTHEHEAVREAPSDYEFSDDHSATVAEEHNEDTGVLDSDVKTVRRSAALPIAAAVGGVLLLGGVAWWQFGGGSSSAPVMPPPVNQMAHVNALPAPTPAMAPAAVPATPDLPTTPTVAAASVAPSQPVAAPTPMPAAAPVASAPVAAMPSAPAAPTVQAAQGVSMPSTAPAATTEAPDPRVEALNKRMEDLQKTLDQMTQQMAQVTNMVSASASPSGTPATKDIEDRLDKLEQQLTTNHQAAPHLAAPATLPSDGSMAETAPVVHTPKLSHHVAPKAKVSHKSASISKKSASSWVLRAASPGQAWVASSASSHDLKQVQIGDTLDGIGTVTAITQNNGNWVVLGTKGSIQ